MTRRTAPFSIALGLICAVALAAPPQLGGPLPGPFPLFPADNWWNEDISGAPVDPNSAALISFIGGDVLHPDFGGTQCPGCDGIYGFPYIIVDSTQPKRNVTFTSYASESDHIGYPIPDEAITQPHWIEGGPPGNQQVPGIDRHMLIVDKDNKHLYELYQVHWDGSKWTAAAGAFFDMKTNNRRPEGWTSTDAAGLAVLPGLVRYDEVYGPDEIRHAFRFTVRLSNGYVYPASHEAGSYPGALPMGARLRLKASKNISGLPPEMQKIARAMKKYGLIVADNGADMFISGTFDTRWNNDILNPAFAALTADDFEVVKLGWVGGPLLQVTSPNGGEQWTVGSSRQITWTSANLASGATAEISLTDGASTTPIASVPASQGSYAWTVPPRPGAGWRIKIDAKSAGTVQAADATDLPFTILTTVSASDATATEGNSGTVNLGVPVTLAAAATTPVTVNYITSNGTAYAGSDFAMASGSLTFAPGETSKTVNVGILGDTLSEPTETFSFVLGGPGNAAIGDGEATITIIDNDVASASFFINDVSVNEGNSGTTNAVLTVTLASAGGQGASVNYTTANGTASAGSDYTAASGNVTFAAGQTSKTISVAVTGDTAAEANETFLVNLSGPSGAAIADGQGQVTIVNDDSGGAVAVVWTSLEGVAANGNSLAKTAATAWGNAGAISTQQIAAGDGFVEFTASETTTYRMVGLSNGNSNSSYEDIDFAFYAHSGGKIYVYEGGVNKGVFGTYVTGDKLRVAVVGGNVKYSRNGTVFYTSSKAPAYPLLVDAALNTQAATINSAVISGASQGGGLPAGPPFGSFDTPLNGTAGVTGAVAVTGWALDDTGVTRLSIYRNPVTGEPTQPNGKVYIGDAIFVPGVRADVASRYAAYPNANRAGWGYMLLTNFLPGGGNGSYTLYAYATDTVGTTTLLGSKTISCANASATKPFGTLDTPGPGATASGAAFVAWGWALTPQPGVIPINGSTIQVYVDGAPVGHPVYNNYRSDIANAFPGYANSNGAIGYYVLDTTKLANGMHTISWGVTDNLGRADGIGSRFFWVQN